MQILLKETNSSFPFDWVNLDYYPDSNAHKCEIYVSPKSNVTEELIILFHTLFKQAENDILLYSSSWWDFCLDTWNANTDTYDYGIGGKSNESEIYLELLKDSDIEIGFSGTCKCMNWDIFLITTLNCVVSHQAPYGHIFYNIENNFFFYFHHSGSIGFYYKETNHVVETILQIANTKYTVR